MTITFSKLGHYGRMGNCLFEIAATIGMAKKVDTDFKFPLWNYERYYNLPKTCWGNSLTNNKYTEPFYAYKGLPNFKSCDLHGYFQSWKYFSHCEDYIREVFSLKDDVEPIKDTCSIHIRRTDYLKFADSHTNLSLDYYKRAMNLVSEDKFLVFSDDTDWCNKIFANNPNIKVLKKSVDIVDFKFMKACSSHIIANSSFSWWAAWLNDSKDKTVIAPKNWFGPKLKPTHPIDDLIPSDWKLI